MEITLAIVGLILSFFFAGSETAFVSANRFRYELWLRQKKRPALTGRRYFQNPDLFLSTTLVGNNISNILASSYATVYFILYIDETLAWLLITFTILTVGEIIPKVFFRMYANQIILKLIYPIRIFHAILNPLILLANRVATFVLTLLRVGRINEASIFDKKDIEVLMAEARISGVVDEDEHRIISKILDLPTRLVREAMVPRTVIQAIEYRRGLNGVRKLMAETGNTKIPVYANSIDNIIGVVFLYDLLLRPKKLREIIRPVQYVPENKRCNELLREFQKTNISIAVVIDEYGGTAGIVTLEDLVERLFGEFDEIPFDVTRPVRALNRTTWNIKAFTSIDLVAEILDISLPPGDYETIGGFITSYLGHIPKAGERLILNDIRIIITKASRQRVEEVRIVKQI